MVKLDIVKEMMVQRSFKLLVEESDYMVGKNSINQYIYIKIFNSKFELNVVREFLWTNFTIDNGNIFLKNSNKNVTQLVIICKSFQNSHVKEFTDISKNIQLMREDFFNINITKKAPFHQKVEETIIINKKAIPTIKENDPNCIFYNFVKGDVIKVIRSDGEICYRLVR